ncbi:MAG TPA: glycoside hydrolase family 15 protein [Polyangia bacterium]|nr:glycoside hydrolase family 15 protein [Polyangia bacterium]
MSACTPLPSLCGAPFQRARQADYGGAVLALLHVLPLAVAAHASLARIPSGNGFGTAIYDASQARLVGLREHTFQNVDYGVPTRDLLYDAYFGVRAGADEAWLAERPVDAVERSAGVITVRQRFGDLRATTTYFVPFALAAPSVVMVLELKNEGIRPVGDVHAFTLHNVRVGDGDGTQAQRADWDAGTQSYVQRSLTSGRRMLIRSVTPPSHHTVTPQDPYPIVRGGGLFPDTDTSGDTNALASGFQYDLGTLAPGESVTVAVVLAYQAAGDGAELASRTGGYIGASRPAELVAAERAQWDAWLAQARVPAGLSADELRLYRQQLSVLRMAQSREPNDAAAGYFPFGQLVASVRPGRWDISWVRDACYSIAALARAGLFAEARAGLEFMLEASAGEYQSYVGRPYRLSVVRYFGRGREESDFNQDGPNVEFDGFGMFLWAASEYLAQGGDPAFLERWWPIMADGVADVLVALVESETGLIRADSSIWETHWDNGARQHFTFTTLFAVVGLERAAAWADRRDAARAARYRQAAETLRRGLLAGLVTPDRVLRPSLEQRATVDAAVVDAFTLGVVDARSATAEATFAALRQALFLPVTQRGFKRNQGGGEYDEREWVVIDLRMAVALWHAGRMDEGDALFGWVRDQALVNHDLVPEQYDQMTGDYAGQAPMAGFGAGALVLATWERAAALGAGTGTGCSCSLGRRSSARAASALAALALLGLPWLVRRTRRRRL